MSCPHWWTSNSACIFARASTTFFREATGSVNWHSQAAHMPTAGVVPIHFTTRRMRLGMESMIVGLPQALDSTTKGTRVHEGLCTVIPGSDPCG